MTPQDFITALLPGAKRSMELNKIPVSFTLAEAALESGWGKSELATRYFNLFGEKADPSWTGPKVSLPTNEFINGKEIPIVAQWRVYTDYQESLLDHAVFLTRNPRYQMAFNCITGPEFAQAVAKAGYATDPQYAQKLIQVMNSHNLTQYDKG